MGTICWSPLAGGWLTGRYRTDADNPIPTSYARRRLTARYDMTLPANQNWVDSDRVALFGTSFSGGHVLAVAAQDRRIAAVVAQCPFVDGLATVRAVGLNARLALAGLKDQLRAAAGRPPHYVPAVGPPGSLAAMTTPDAEPGMIALLPAQTRWENRVAARIALRVGAYRPGRRAARLTCPVLFCLCDQDALTPADVAARYAAAAPRSEIKGYPVGHFDIYVDPTWHDAVADQTGFLVRHLLVEVGDDVVHLTA